MVDPKLHPDHNVFIKDVIPSLGPGADAGPAARLVRVQAAGVELAVPVGRDVDVVVCELGATEVEGLGVGEHFLEGGSVDFVRDREPVDGVVDRGVLDLEDAVGVGREVEAAGGGHRGGGYGVAYAVGVEI